MKLKITNISEMVYNSESNMNTLEPSKFNPKKLISSLTEMVIYFGYPVNNYLNIFVR